WGEACRVREVVGLQRKHVRSAGGDHIEEAALVGFGAIGGGGCGIAIRVRVEAADDACVRVAQAAHQIELHLRVDEKAALGVVGDVLRFVDLERTPAVGGLAPYDNDAAFVRI